MPDPLNVVSTLDTIVEAIDKSIAEITKKMQHKQEFTAYYLRCITLLSLRKQEIIVRKKIEIDDIVRDDYQEGLLILDSALRCLSNDAQYHTIYGSQAFTDRMLIHIDIMRSSLDRIERIVRRSVI